MKLLRLLWDLRILIIFAALGVFSWYESNESEKKRIIQEEQFKAQEAEKKVREERLFAQYQSLKSKTKCGIELNVILETFGEDVNVELRSGELGNSFPLVVKRAKSSKLHYDGLCEGNYFIAIGNDDQVSTTPVERFVKGTVYTSTVTLTKGVGNVSSHDRRNL
jgi:hypothetical protein